MRNASKIIVLLLVVALFSGCANTPAETPTEAPTAAPTGAPTTEPQPTEPKYPYDYTKTDFFQVENCLNYAPMAKLVGVQSGAPFDFKKTEDGYTVAQGAATDGTYGYFALCNPNANIGGEYIEAARIVKVDLATWEIVKTGEPIRTCHSNGMTYNSKTNKLLVVHNKPEFQNISIVDPETLQVEEVVTMDRAIQSIGYSAERDQYVVRMSGNWNFVVLDADFNEVAYIETGVTTPLGSQCMTCDDDYIYMLDSGVTKMPGYECFTVYDWSGKYLGVYRLPSMQESEALLIVGDTYYVTFFNGSGGRLYELQFDASRLGNYQPN